jgi:5'-nucleotidase
MHFLVSNDDGYNAQGIVTLVKVLRQFGRVTMIAPERDRSGVSNSLTLDRPLRVRELSPEQLVVDGTPTDCVHIALTSLLATPPDFVISGINNGANLGDDTVYSGTVAAATEGYLFNIPAVAFSMVDRGYTYLDHAEHCVTLFMKKLIAAYQANQLAPHTLLNVNIPDPAHKTDGEAPEFKWCRLGRRHTAEPAIPVQSPKGETVYWIGAAGAAADTAPDTDFYAVANGDISVTPLQMDLTHYAHLALQKQQGGAVDWLSVAA